MAILLHTPWVAKFQIISPIPFKSTKILYMYLKQPILSFFSTFGLIKVIVDFFVNVMAYDKKVQVRGWWASFRFFSSQKLWHFASLFICCDGYPTPLKPEPSIHLPLFRRPLAYWPSALSMNYVHCATRVVKHFSTKWNNSRLLWPLFLSHKETVFCHL